MRPARVLVERFKDKSKKLRHLLDNKLWLQVLLALLLGLVVGIFLGPDAGLVSKETAKAVTDWLALPGVLFLRLVKMIIIPLIFSSIIVGILSSGDEKFLKKIGPKLALYFVLTTFAATIIGFSVATIMQPGQFVDIASVSLEGDIEAPIPTDGSVPERIMSIVPANPIEAMVSGDMLGIVIFTIIIALSLMLLRREQKDFALEGLQIVQEVSMRIVRWAMYLVPLAVFGLMTQIAARIGVSALAGLSMYIITVLVGLLVLVVMYNIIVLFSHMRPSHFMSNIRDVQLLAFSTSSSAAVMPMSMRTAEDKLHVRREISEFLIPVGATINMDGTALYQVVATVFLSQVFGIDLSFAMMLMIATITVGASIGAPSVPGVGIVILASILDSVGIPATGIALILGVDRILDMCRTSVNVTGDLTACVFFNNKLKASE